MTSKKIQETPEPEGISINIPSATFGKFFKGAGNPLVLLPLLALCILSVKPLIGVNLSYLMSMKANAPAIVLVLSVAAAYLSVKSKKDVKSYGIAGIMVVSALFSMYSNSTGNFLAQDFDYFAIMAAIFALFYALAVVGSVQMEIAAVVAVFLSTFLLHMVSANDGMIGNIDPYWQYKWMRGIYDTGYPPEHDYLVYPMFGGLERFNDPSYVKGRPTFGLDQSKTAMFTPVSYTFLALSYKSFGLSLEDTAIIFPGVISALTIVLMYLLVSEMFTEMQPYNKIAAFFAAFMLMLSPGFGISSVATNCEDDALGMFFMVAGLFLFFASIRRRNIQYSVLCGFSFLLLRIGWGGAYYAFMTVGIFGTIYVLVQFLHGKNPLEHLPYILIPTAIYQLMGLIIHARGGMPLFHMVPPNALYPTITAIALPILLEAVRLARGGEKFTLTGSQHERLISNIEKIIYPLTVLSIIAGIVFFVYVRSPQEMVSWVIETAISPSINSIVHQTVAEQNQLGDSFLEYAASAYDRYGVAFVYALFMIPLMSYLVYKRASIGALFLLTWAVPMMYGVYYKSAWVFASSAAITALGSTVGLFAAASKKDLDSFRVVGSIMLLVIPALYIPMLGTTMFNKFVGYQVMHMGVTNDRRFWEPALAWHRDRTGQGDAIVTWWDYGHWITSVSQRPVLIDNLQADYYEIQDVARFFVNKTTEEEAVDMLRPYEVEYQKNKGWGIKYVTIDWTMIGKGSALHYIATGVIENRTPGSWKNYIQCEFIPEASDTKEQLKINPDGTFTKGMNLVFGCQNQHALVFELSEDKITNTYVITPYRRKIPWNTFSAANDVSILGVQPLLGMNEQRVPSIMACVSGKLPQEYRWVCSMPQFNTLVWVPQEFNDFMMTRLYLGKYLGEYRELGYYTRDVKPLKYFRQVPDYNGDGLEDGEFNLGFVRSYEVNFDGYTNSTET